MHKLSVVMATYNGEKFVREQIESILNQTLVPNEIIISDDASNDQTVDILIEYQKKYPALIKIILNKNNVGFVKNFERALLNATGDFMALSDQDDVWMSEKLKIEYEVLEKYPNVGLVFSDLKIVDEKLNEIYSSMWQYHSWDLNGYIHGTQFFKQILKSNRVTGCTIMIRKNIISQLIPFDDRILFHDYWLALGASLLSDVFAVNKQLVLYRQHLNNQIGAGVKKEISYNRYLINLQKGKVVLHKEFLFYEYLFEFVNQHLKESSLVSTTKDVYEFHRLRDILYSSQNIFIRIREGFKLLFRLNFYVKKSSFLKDITDIVSPKIRASKFYFHVHVASKLKGIPIKENNS